jgi:hypothetical protein
MLLRRVFTRVAVSLLVISSLAVWSWLVGRMDRLI